VEMALRRETNPLLGDEMSFSEFVVEDDELIRICSRLDGLDASERECVEKVKGKTKLSHDEDMSLQVILRKRGIAVLRPV
jgi:hypothetical protein